MNSSTCADSAQKWVIKIIHDSQAGPGGTNHGDHGGHIALEQRLGHAVVAAGDHDIYHSGAAKVRKTAY